MAGNEQESNVLVVEGLAFAANQALLFEDDGGVASALQLPGGSEARWASADDADGSLGVTGFGAAIERDSEGGGWEQAEQRKEEEGSHS